MGQPTIDAIAWNRLLKTQDRRGVPIWLAPQPFDPLRGLLFLLRPETPLT